MKPPDDDEPVVNDDPSLGDATVHADEPPAPAPVVGYTAADFDAMLGSFTDLALHVVFGDDDGDRRPRARVGRYERREP